MITSPNAYFTAEEAKLRGNRKVVFFTIFPYYHSSGVASGSGTFQNCAFVSPDKILATYDGFASGYWYSPVMLADLGKYPVSAVFTLTHNSPGFDMTLKWKSAPTQAQLAAASYTTISPGETLSLYRYYQWGVWWAGVRCWASDGEPEDDFTAWAQESATSDEYDSYAEDPTVRGDSQTYISGVLFTGEYPIPLRDVIDPGQLTIESSVKFSEIIAGDHSLQLSNAQRDADNVLAPKYSPHKAGSFIFGSETDWYNRKLKIEAGYVRPGTRNLTYDLITLYFGQIYKWGPLPRSVDAGGKPSLPTVEIYSKDWIAEALKRKIALPDSEGNPQPFFHGEYLAKADEVSGKPLGDPVRTIGFEGNNLEELDNTTTAGGGVLSINSTTPLVGSYSMRAAVSGANQSAYGQINLPVAQDELFVRFPWRWATIASSPVADNCKIWKVLNAAGSEILRFSVYSDGKLRAYAAGTYKETSWSIATHDGIRADIGLWIKTGASGQIALWVGGDQVLDWTGVNLSGSQAKNFLFGIITGATSETWVADIDNIRTYYSYLPNAFQVAGFPFTEIKSVYVDKQVYTASDMTKYEAYGAVSFAATDTVSGEVMLRVVKDTINHPVDIVEDIITEVSLDGYINAASFTAAKALRPDDQIGVCFTDISAGDAITEILSRCLYSLFVDQGEIRIKAYEGTPPASAVLSLNASELRNLEPAWDMEDAQKGVMVKWGWFDRNPDLFYVAGDNSEGDVEELDFTVDSPVFSESEIMTKALADLYFKRVRYGKEILEAVKSSWRSLRVELGDGIEVDEGLLYDTALKYETLQKMVSLGAPHEVDLQLARFLGE